MPSSGRTSAGPTPESHLQSVWAEKRRRRIPRRPGQHRSTPHSDHSAKAGKAYEVVVAYTIIDRQPIYRNVKCPYCNAHADVIWTPMSRVGNLAPTCTSCRRVIDFSIKTPEHVVTTKPTVLTPVQEAIKKRQWDAFLNRRQAR
jgi:transposase-like protein